MSKTAAPSLPGLGRTLRGRPSDRAAAFAALRTRNFRWYLAGRLVSGIGDWIQRIAQSWLVLTLTGSTTDVAVTLALQFLPIVLLAVAGGGLADRIDKRRLLLVCEVCLGLLAATLAMLTLYRVVQIWEVYALAFGLGLVCAVEAPARKAFVPELVGEEQLASAVGLTLATYQTTRLVGPAVAGLLTTTVGIGWAFAANAASFVAVVAALLGLRTAELHPAPSSADRQRAGFREGLHDVAGRPRLVRVLLLAAAVGTFGYNFSVVLPGFAYHVFHSGLQWYGLMNTALAAGALAGSVLIARRRHRTLDPPVAAVAVFCILEMTTALAPSPWVFVCLLAALGLAGGTIYPSCTTAALTLSDPAMRGRVMALLTLGWEGTYPASALVTGLVCAHMGARAAMVLCGLIPLLVATAIITHLRHGRGRGSRFRAAKVAP